MSASSEAVAPRWFRRHTKILPCVFFGGLPVAILLVLASQGRTMILWYAGFGLLLGIVGYASVGIIYIRQARSRARSKS